MNSCYHPSTATLSVIALLYQLLWLLYQLLSLSGFVVLIYDILLRLGMLAAAKRLHLLILHAVLFAPLTFTDTTPLGRILARFSKDMDVVDEELPWEISDLLYCLFEVRH